MTETEVTSKLSNFISKYWIWLLTFFGIIGIIALMWYFWKRTKTTEKSKL